MGSYLQMREKKKKKKNICLLQCLILQAEITISRPINLVFSFGLNLF